VSNSTNRRDVLRKIKVDEEPSDQIEGSSRSLDQIAVRYDLTEALEACRSLRKVAKPQKNAQQPDTAPAKHIMRDFEHDFTTPGGKPSSLECPFAKMTNGDPPREIADPIAAEFHGEGSVGSGTAYAHQNPNNCPIRYLDQHSPEEVAKYFENHKHEIPRSHAVCISRYQQNDAKIRQLDAKYGNLQSMIQSLGIQHQQYLPTKDAEEVVRREPAPPATGTVEKWAENVSRRSGDAATQPVQSQQNGLGNRKQEEETQQFERPLREIRLGESPSRPWGISVPLAQQTAASAIASDKAIEPLSLDKPDKVGTPAVEKQKKEQEPVAQCPFDHGTKKGDGSSAAPKEGGTNVSEDRMREASSRPQMIFNGPVFFGYNLEQATALVQSGAFEPSKVQH
jgi:hypothetical protein